MWKTVKLDDIAKPMGGSGFPKKYQGKKEGEIPFFKVSDMNLPENDKHMNTANNFVSRETLKEMKAKTFPAGTIIFPKIGGAISTNKKRILTRTSAFDNNVMGLIPSEKISSEYLYLVFLGLDLYEISNKAALPSITATAVKEITISLPPLAEQERIVAKLDVAFAEIDEAVENANTKEFEINKLQASILSASLSTNAIKSELTPITELCNDIYAGGDAPAKVNISKVKTKKYKTPIYSNGVKDSGLYGYTTFEPRTLQPAITISARGTIGHIEVRNKPFLPIVRLIVLEPKIEKIDLTFLKFALLSMKIFSSGSSIPQLTVPMLKKMNLSLPPLAEQKQIVKKLNTAYREFENISIFIEKSRQSYKSLKSAILAQELQSSQGKVA